MRFDSASVRIERLEETAVILKGLFGDEHFSFEGEHYTIRDLRERPRRAAAATPIMIGGGGRKVLSVAARQADIVQLMPSNRGAGTVPRYVAVLGAGRSRRRSAGSVTPPGPASTRSS